MSKLLQEQIAISGDLCKEIDQLNKELEATPLQSAEDWFDNNFTDQDSVYGFKFITKKKFLEYAASQPKQDKPKDEK